MLYGLTVDNPWDSVRYIDKVADALPVRATVRLVWDEPGSGMEWNDFATFCDMFSRRFDVMACVLDSYPMKDVSVKEYKNRAELVSSLESVKIIECGNEIAGDWLGPDDVVFEKVNWALRISKAKLKYTAVTWFLSGDNPGLVESARKKANFQNVDYNLLSFYQNWNPEFKPDWSALSKQYDGIGEYGPQPDKPGISKLRRMVMDYEQNIVPEFRARGGFYWDASKYVFSGAAVLLDAFIDVWSVKVPELPILKPAERVSYGEIEKALSESFTSVIGYSPDSFVRMLAPEVHKRLK